MKVVILAGGFGTRLSEYTNTIPKPMVKINSKPLITYIIEHYRFYGHKDFLIALGYKSAHIKRYFKKNRKYYSDCSIKLIDTGLKTMTGGRVKRLKKYLDNNRFFLTYGDGISSVNLEKLKNFHINNNNLITLTAVRPPARFGVVKIGKSGKVSYFKEKSKLDAGWINGGFFIVEPKFIELIKNDRTYLEREPLERAQKKNKLGAFKHNGFWHCVDTKRDLDNICKIIKKNGLFKKKI